MNKLAKGAIAGAAGVALLLGGAGTFAFWNSTADIAGGTITAGDLLVEQDGTAGVWVNQLGTVIDIADYRIVPGDTLTFTDDVLVTAVGDTLEATLGLGGGSIASDGTAAGDALAARLTAGAVVTATGPGITAAAAPNTYDIVAADGTGGSIVDQEVTLAVTITFPFAGDPATQDNPAKNGVVSLAGMNITLTQVQ